ncbi:hypothetical protein [Chlamydia vaughanii]|uniref:hypothetical protein n=1 Tax=Chlamydia vaughanii TaxID=3112552 RepID=UPI0032B1D21A
MRKQNFFLSKIKPLSVLILASLTVLISGCLPNDIFTYDKEVAEEAKSLAPSFKTVEHGGKVWEEIKSAWTRTEKLNCVPVLIHDELMNPVIFASKTKSLWHVPVSGLQATRMFNYAIPTTKEKKPGDKNYADINVVAFKAGKETVSFSGVLYGVDKEAFITLCKHYSKHSLLPLVVSRVEEDGLTSYSLGFVFSVTDPALISPIDALPQLDRFNYIWNSINNEDVTSSYGPEFPKRYVDTTFLANGTTIAGLIPPPGK